MYIYVLCVVYVRCVCWCCVLLYMVLYYALYIVYKLVVVLFTMCMCLVLFYVVLYTMCCCWYYVC